MKLRKTTLQDAICQDAFEWLSGQAPIYLEAIENELAAGATPDMIYMSVLREVGPDRLGLAKRCQQAARWLSGPGTDAN